MAKVTLYAQGDYPNIEVDFKEVDIVGAEDVGSVLAEVTDGKIITAKKDVTVQAEPAQLGQEVDTNPRAIVDGKAYTFSETKQVIQQKHLDAGSVLVHNPDGEVYVVKGEKFAKTYEATEDGYRPVDGPKKFVTVTEDICFKAPWGEMIYAPKGSKLCVEYLESRDVYSVTNSAFNSTYKEVEQNDEAE